jgi:hypothetical protein
VIAAGVLTLMLGIGVRMSVFSVVYAVMLMPLEIILREIPKENWGIRGGQAGCDIELGFKIEV